MSCYEFSKKVDGAKLVGPTRECVTLALRLKKFSVYCMGKFSKCSYTEGKWCPHLIHNLQKLGRL